MQDFDSVAVEDGDKEPEKSAASAGTVNNNTKAVLHRSTQPLLIIIGTVMSSTSLLHFLGVLIHHQVGIGRAVKHDVGS